MRFVARGGLMGGGDAGFMLSMWCVLTVGRGAAENRDGNDRDLQRVPSGDVFPRGGSNHLFSSHHPEIVRRVLCCWPASEGIGQRFDLVRCQWDTGIYSWDGDSKRPL